MPGRLDGRHRARPGSPAKQAGRTPCGIPRRERIAEAPRDLVQRLLRGEGLQRPVGDAVEDPDVVDAGDMVRMRVREQHRVDPGNATVEQLGSHIGRCIDQKPLTFAHFRSRCWIACGGCAAPPDRSRPSRRSRPRRRSSARRRSRRCRAASPACGCLPETAGGNSRWSGRPAPSGVIPRTSASTFAVARHSAGSLRLPRNGTGARYGRIGLHQQPVRGTSRAISRSSFDLGKVRMPEKLMIAAQFQRRLGQSRGSN